jgi:hypothetical protein
MIEDDALHVGNRRSQAIPIITKFDLGNYTESGEDCQEVMRIPKHSLLEPISGFAKKNRRGYNKMDSVRGVS